MSQVGSLREAVERGDRCWSRVLMDWELWRREDLTQHENGWPAVYRAACAAWNVPPDPAVEPFATSYEGRRGDLREVSG